MGRVAKRHQLEIAKIATDVSEAFEASGTDLAAQRALIPHLEELQTRVETGKLNPSTLLKSYLPALWKEIGVAIDVPAATARARLFTYDIETRGELAVAEAIRTLRQDDNENYDRSLARKIDEKTPFNQEIWEGLRDVCERWLVAGGETENDRIARLVLAISFFTGRRPWSETAFLAKFSPVDLPVRRDWKVYLKSAPDYETDFDLVETPIEEIDWCDGWLRFDGNAKRTKKEDLAGFSIPIDIPVLGIDPDDILEALSELRSLERGKVWFRTELDAVESTIGSVLEGNVSKAIRQEITPILAPIYQAGHRFPDTDDGRFTAYHLRAMYACRMIAGQEEGTGKKPDPTVTSKYLLGHFGGLGKASLAYQSFEYLGDKPIR